MIKITCDRVVNRGIPYYKVKKIEGAMTYEELPDSYTRDYPHCVGEREYNSKKLYEINIRTGRYSVELIRVGITYTEEEMGRKLHLLKKCGERLHKARLDEKILRSWWHGEVSFEI